MIAYLDGRVMRGGTEAVIALASALGLDVLLSSRTAERLPAVGENVRLWTHLAVREDSWTLYGFLSTEERDMFRLLISVSGVGPKVALGMLSGASPADLARFLRTGDEKSLVRLHGIGKKSAARLVVELGERVGDAWLRTAGADAQRVADEAARTPLTDAVAILGAMGLPAGQAERALLAARDEESELTEDLESWVKAALRSI